MVEVEIDGRKVEVPEGSMLMQAANKLDIYIPHFCYHKKLSIAANCRMCLVEVEKAPKPLPACATPVTTGMKAYTRSEKAVKAQQGVMEFLLINHPLDCPICDQGGECQLQDLAVGYGASSSHYHEEKRVVFHKHIGPLVAAQEMSRCIQCTRCVRFGQEIAGQMELGMAGRGEHSEIMSFLGRSVESELSGNMIDICPVGALTSKPFRYTARTWELTRRKSIAPHDSLGSNIVVQVKIDRVMRVLPLENEAVNEMWLSDRDRFSYEGINSPDRLRAPMIKQDGKWQEVPWPVALEYVAKTLASVKREHGAAAIGALGAPNATCEELWLLGALVRGLGADNVDFRLRQHDFSIDAARRGAPWLGMPVAAVDDLDAMLFVGSFLRKDHPLFSARVRGAARRGARVMRVDASGDDWLMPVAGGIRVAPDRWVEALADVLVACCTLKEEPVPDAYRTRVPSAEARAIAESLVDAERAAIWLGNAATQHPSYAALARLAQAIGDLIGATHGVIGESANSVGGYLVGAWPGRDGLGARAMLLEPRKAYLLLGLEPSLDCGDPVLARQALSQASSVIALSAFQSPELLELADCLLPIGTFAETGGSFVNTEGRLQSFNGVARAPGDARPAWKVLRVLGNQLGIPGFDFDGVDDVARAAFAGVDVVAALDNTLGEPALPAIDAGATAAGAGALQRLADVPIYAVDPLVRRAPSLQLTVDARPPAARINAGTLARLGIASGDRVRVSQGGATIEVDAILDDAVADGVVRLAAAHPVTAALPGMFGPLTVERA
ncbi:MAG: NADH-quinone oxidoreductase subunit NuoG [Lautropia sp.]